MRGLIFVLAAVPVLGLAACAGTPPGGAETRFVGHTGAGAGRTVRVPEMAELSGQSSIAIRGLLGEPAMTRREAPAEVWQYAGQACVLDIVFYPDAAGGGPNSRWIEGRDMDGKTMPPEACLQQVVRNSR